MNILEPPRPPLSRIIKVGTLGSCPKCGSTEKYQYRLMG